MNDTQSAVHVADLTTLLSQCISESCLQTCNKPCSRMSEMYSGRDLNYLSCLYVLKMSTHAVVIESLWAKGKISGPLRFCNAAQNVLSCLMHLR